ncbi:MAG: hypothetical protein DWI22_18205 [Planctomycetota bacterium]|nr:MAG: hypothetical protein DWI22_18205 [Planctomycetota bacterium]
MKTALHTQHLQLNENSTQNQLIAATPRNARPETSKKTLEFKARKYQFEADSEQSHNNIMPIRTCAQRLITVVD